MGCGNNRAPTRLTARARGWILPTCNKVEKYTHRHTHTHTHTHLKTLLEIDKSLFCAGSFRCQLKTLIISVKTSMNQVSHREIIGLSSPFACCTAKSILRML